MDKSSTNFVSPFRNQKYSQQSYTILKPQQSIGKVKYSQNNHSQLLQKQSSGSRLTKINIENTDIDNSHQSSQLIKIKFEAPQQSIHAIQLAIKSRNVDEFRKLLDDQTQISNITDNISLNKFKRKVSQQQPIIRLRNNSFDLENRFIKKNLVQQEQINLQSQRQLPIAMQNQSTSMNSSNFHINDIKGRLLSDQLKKSPIIDKLLMNMRQNTNRNSQINSKQRFQNVIWESSLNNSPSPLTMRY
ncbi:UNKNOWN [Stylonychia lemnae]|uniref:Uncharacterized protein n=1 Tax=Stylonychia lemnae TaxID=5949 RepID=A0A078AN59_STYLE|nr:UNKNOWN [Stylonychia lemnae]|eukprot:CDW83599.1 UNKNOWN [Stylonychia lemnae]